MGFGRSALVWTGVAAAVAAPIALATTSPFLAFRDPLYIAAGFAGIAALALLLVQPLLAGGALPGLSARSGRRVHGFVGVALVALVAAHVGGLLISSPPDAIDALLFQSPTAFSHFGVIAMWAVFAAAALAALRGWRRVPPLVWRPAHTVLALVIVTGTVAHAVLVEGAMETISKVVLCLLVLGATAKTVLTLRAWAVLGRRKT